MALRCGIVGLPNVGKSTLFNALSTGKAEAANRPFCTIDPNIGVANVPDYRLNALAELAKPQKVTPATMEFVDIAGLVKGASRGEGLGNKFLANIREVDAVLHVVRCFTDQNVAHVAGEIKPVEDKEIIDAELQLKDLESMEKKILRVEKVAKVGDAKAKKELEILLHYKAHLESGKNARDIDLDEPQKLVVADLQLLTAKPVLYVLNVDEGSIHSDNELTRQFYEAFGSEAVSSIKISGSIESQISELDDEEEKMAYLREFELKESGLDRLIRASYSLLNLITFFTAGPKEVRAWTIKKGWKAPKAAGAIHSDFERGFIRAEVIKVEDYIKYKTEAACREVGKIAVEGKEYVVKDGDVMHFRFNV
jgi:ribosome-binding ATPase